MTDHEKCAHPIVEEVTSRDGKKVHGTRCLRCNKQWVVDICTGCRRGVRHVAKSDRISWTCRKCVRLQEGEA